MPQVGSEGLKVQQKTATQQKRGERFTGPPFWGTISDPFWNTICSHVLHLGFYFFCFLWLSARLLYVFWRLVGLPSLIWTIICSQFRGLGIYFLLFSELHVLHMWERVGCMQVFLGPSEPTEDDNLFPLPNFGPWELTKLIPYTHTNHIHFP